MSSVQKDDFCHGTCFFEGGFDAGGLVGGGIGPDKEDEDVCLGGAQLPGERVDGIFTGRGGGEDVLAAEADVVSAVGIGRIADGAGDGSRGDGGCGVFQGLR